MPSTAVCLDILVSSKHHSVSSIGLFFILGIELELASNGGSCGAIFSHANTLNDNLFPRMSPPLQATSGSIPRL